MDTARYIVAVLTWVALPPAVIYWLIIHPFAERWRRLGVAKTMTIAFTIFVALAVVLFVTRDLVLVREFGTHWTLWVVATMIYLMSIAIELWCRKQLKFKTLTGVPELQKEQSGRKLLNEGIYAKVRHPRYINITVATLALTVFANYLVIWIMLPTVTIALYLIAVLEERELVRSMGNVYEEYRRQVPMFIPRFERRPSS